MRTLIFFLLPLAVAGCVLKPHEATDEARNLATVGARLGYAATQRSVPDLPASPNWRDVLQRAFLANGDLEASYHEWAMAIHRIDQAGSWPSQPVELGFEYMFSGERMKSFDRMTFSAGLMDASALPNKTYASAKVAWRDAQAAGERFRAAKFDLQMKVLQSWADYALQAERIRIQQQNLELLRLVANTAASRVRAGASQQEQLRADVAFRTADNELATARATLEQQRARLNGLLMRGADASLVPLASMPTGRPLPMDDQTLIAASVSNSPDLAALGHDRESREAAIQRARLEYLPEINPMAVLTGSLSQSIGAAVVLPTQLPKINAMVAEARSDLRRVEMSLAQAKSDRSARFLATLFALRDAERRGQVFESDIVPLAERTVQLSRQGYAAGASTYIDLIDAQRTLLDARLMAAEARTVREKMLAELEALAGMDIEAISPAATTRPQE